MNTYHVGYPSPGSAPEPKDLARWKQAQSQVPFPTQAARRRRYARLVALTRLLVGTCIAAGAIAGLSGPTAADEPERYNCPAGFIWVRTSGTGCVQEDLPPHGKTGFDGHPLCTEPFVGILEQRPTTDGKGVPGNPATSFPYLIECLTPQEFEGRQQDAGTTVPPDAGEKILKDSGMPLPPGQLVLLGALGTGALVFAALPNLRRRNGGKPAEPVPAVQASSGPPSTPEGQDEGEAPLDAEELKRRDAALERIDEELERQMEEYRQAAAAGQLTPQDVVTWTGIVADFAALIPGAQVPAGVLSLAANMAGMIGQEWFDTRDLNRAVREGLGAMAWLRGQIAGDRESYAAALAELEKASGPVVPPVAPEHLPDKTLRDARDQAQQRTLEAAQQAVDAADDWSRKSEKLREKQQQIDYLNDHLPDLDDPPTRERAADANVWLDLAAGLDSMTKYHQNVKATAGSKAARDSLMKIFQGKPLSGVFPGALDEAVDLGATARSTSAAGKYASGVSGVSAAASMYNWFHSRSVEEQRVIVEQAIEGLQYEAGRMEADARQAEASMNQASARSKAEAARRSALSAEIDVRDARAGNLLWRK